NIRNRFSGFSKGCTPSRNIRVPGLGSRFARESRRDTAAESGWNPIPEKAPHSSSPSRCRLCIRAWLSRAAQPPCPPGFSRAGIFLSREGDRAVVQAQTYPEKPPSAILIFTPQNHAGSPVPNATRHPCIACPFKTPICAGTAPFPARPRSPSRNLSFLWLRVPGALFALGYRRRAPAARTGQLSARRHLPAAERSRYRNQPNAGGGIERPSALGGIPRRERDDSRHAQADACTVPRRGTQQAALCVFHPARADPGISQRAR